MDMDKNGHNKNGHGQWSTWTGMSMDKNAWAWTGMRMDEDARMDMDRHENWSDYG